MTTTTARRGRRSHRLLLSLVLPVGLALGPASAASATTTPGVNATPYNATAHPWDTDGCSVVPDSGLHTSKVWTGYGTLPHTASFDFNHACVHHDGCYRGRWASRATCDSWFLNDMRASCAASHPRSWASREVCANKAYQYYLGVRAFGAGAYAATSSHIPIA
jgi:hypothetical protein